MIKNYVKNFLLSFFLFSIAFSLFCIFMYHGITKGIVMGFAGGLFFSVVITIFVKNTTHKLKIKCDEEFGSENIKFYDGANLWWGCESVGGLLVILNDSIQFRPHNINFSNVKCALPFEQIIEVGIDRKIRTIYIKMDTGDVFRFVVNNRGQWVDCIRKYMSGECDT